MILFKEIKKKLNKRKNLQFKTPMKVSVFRKEHFNSAHRLNNPEWSDEKNQAVFGKCNNPNFHGHNYELIVVVKGEIDPETGYVYDMKLLSDLTKEHVLNKFDHKNLNLDTDEFRNLNPSAENIAVVIWNILREKIDWKFELTIRLYETERNYAEYDGN
jgi:6-pyruvoyltetrahydropterin/6-carboxytetrahydropterin synthase